MRHSSQTLRRSAAILCASGLAMSGLLLSAPTAFGADPVYATINTDTTTALYIHKYDLSADPTEKATGQYSDIDNVPATAKPLNGATFAVTPVQYNAKFDPSKVTTADGDTSYSGDYEWKTFDLSDRSQWLKLQDSNGEALDIVDTTANDIEAQYKFQFRLDPTTDNTTTVTTQKQNDGNPDGEAQKDGIAKFQPKGDTTQPKDGLYFVKETGSGTTTVQEFISPFVVTLPLSTSTGSWNYTPHVFPKNKGLGKVTKSLIGGDTLSPTTAPAAGVTNTGIRNDGASADTTSKQLVWRISSILTDPIKYDADKKTGGYTKFEVVDHLADGASVTTATGVKVVLAKSAPASFDVTSDTAKGISVLATGDYTLKSSTDGKTFAAAGATVSGPNHLKVELSPDGLAKINALGDDASDYKLYVLIKTAVDPSKYDATNGSLVNKASDSFTNGGNNGGGNTDPNPNDPNDPNHNGYDVTATLNIYKYAATSGDGWKTKKDFEDATKDDASLKLAGSVFTIYQPKDASALTALDDAACKALDPASDTAKKLGTLTTQTGGTISGKVTIGTSKDTTSGKFCLAETEATSGYKTPGHANAKMIILTAPVTDKDGTTSTNELDVAYANKQLSTIDKLVKLPLTGAAGQMILMIAGVALIGGGALWLVAARRRRNEDA